MPSDALTADSGPRPRRSGPRPRRVLAVLTAVAAVGLTFAAFGGSSASAGGSAHAAALTGLYGSLPAVGTPSKGGTVTVGQLTGSTPTYIFPIIPGADASVYTAQEFMYNLYLPLYFGPVGASSEIDYQLSPAEKPVFSDGDKTVTITLKSNFKWSDGKPVDANDVVFDIDLIQQAVKESAANWSAFTPGFFPQSLASISTKGKYTVVMHLKKAYNPSFFINDQLEGAVFPIPSSDWNIDKAGGPHLDYTVPANAKKIYDYLSKLGGDVASFGTNPLWKIVDGPFKLDSFSATNSSYVLGANAAYGGSPKPSLSAVDVNTYTGITPQLNALKAGGLDVAGLDFSQLGDADSLRASGFSVFGYPNLGFFGAFINFKDKTDHFGAIASQLYVRQALVELEDQPAYLTGIFKNAGVVAYGPVPSLPPTPFTPADAIKPPYPYDPAKAVALLSSHGWKVVPNGQTTCVKAGTGAGECGAGIPAGTPFKFTWYYIPASETPSAGLESEAFASEAKEAAGINIALESKTFNYIIANYDDANPADDKYINDWGIINFGGFTDDYYPTTNSLFNTGGDYNLGDYDSNEANALINNSVFSSDPKAVTHEASYLTENVPILFFPNSDEIFAVSNKVGGPAASFLSATQYSPYYQYWYLNK
jgi:peptide/nickel transport system substrate-binding protein